MLCGAEADKACIWRIGIIEFQSFALVSFVSTTRDGFLMSNTADQPIFPNGLGVLMPMSDRLARWIGSLGFFPIVCEKGLDPVMSYVAFRSGQEVE